MGHTQAIERNLEKFKQLGCQVVIIANGSREEGLVWQKEHPYKFPALIDPEWLLYRKLGLRRYVHFLTTEVMIAYGEALVKGIPFPKLTYDDDDLCIMGGDLIRLAFVGTDASYESYWLALCFCHLCNFQISSQV